MSKKSGTTSDEEHWAYRTERAFKKSVRDEIAKHRAAGDPVYAMRNGRVVKVSDKLPRDSKTGKLKGTAAGRKRGK